MRHTKFAQKQNRLAPTTVSTRSNVAIKPTRFRYAPADIKQLRGLSRLSFTLSDCFGFKVKVFECRVMAEPGIQESPPVLRSLRLIFGTASSKSMFFIKSPEQIGDITAIIPTDSQSHQAAADPAFKQQVIAHNRVMRFQAHYMPYRGNR
jgi:hypothetical protein